MPASTIRLGSGELAYTMYVLHHADKPESIRDFLENPTPSASSSNSWKGLIKPIAIAGIAFAAVTAFVHWITVGPNDVEQNDEDEADRLLKKAEGS